MNRIKELPKSTSHLLTCSQLVTSVYSVVKELIENSIDSSAKNIEIKLEDYGLEKIEVKDNGSGIHKDDLCFVAKPHCTSKITSHLDLNKVETYGFRGEALAAICAVSDFSITTKTDDDDLGFIYTFDHRGVVLMSKPCSLNKGTIVTAVNLFKNVPVRKQLYRNNKVKKEELKKVEDILIAFGCIQPGLRISLYHDQNLIWQKLTARSTSEGLQQVFSYSVFEHMENYNFADDENQISIELFLPKRDAPKICSLSSPSRSVVAVNKRPVRMKLLDKIIKEQYSKTLENGIKSCYPICYVSINVRSSEVDVNFEPIKTVVAMQNIDLVVQHLSEVLSRFYSKNLIIETDANVNNLTLKENNTGTKFQNEINQKDTPTVQRNQPHFTSKDIQNNTEKEVSLGNLVSADVMLESHLKQGFQNTMSRENQVTRKLCLNKDFTTPSSKRVKTSSYVSPPSKDVVRHIQTLDNFFSSTENTTFQTTAQSIVSETPMIVSLQRSNSNMSIELNPNSAEPLMTKDSSLLPSDSPKRNIHSLDPFVQEVSQCNNRNQTSSISNISVGNNEWSRGKHPTENTSIQPVAILKPQIAESARNSKGNIRVVESLDSKRQFDGEFQNQRKITPFDIFCRKNRLEVASLNPTMSNQQIAQILTEKWSQLTSEEKAVYRNVINKDFSENLKKQGKQEIVSTKLDEEKNALLKSKKPMKMKHKYLERDISFNIKDTLSSTSDLKDPDDSMKVINSISPGIWICFQENKLYLLNSFRLQEAVVYKRLLETFYIEADPLDTPFVIPISSFDSDDMNIILQLSHRKVHGNEILISDERLTANGFEIRLLKDEHEIQIEVIGLTKALMHYGVPDLKEILSLIRAKDNSTRLSDCRPAKASLYLQGEAIRIARQYPSSKRLEDIEDLLKQKHLLDVCVHSEIFLHVLHTISTDPAL